MAYLLVRAGEPAGVQFQLDKNRVVIGRASDADFQVPNGFISSRHAEVSEDGGRHLIADLDSTNGTLVNGQKIGPNPVQLRNGDLIVLANDTARIQYVSDDDGTILMGPLPLERRRLFRVDEGARDVYLGAEVLSPPLARRLFDVLNLLYKHEGNVCSARAIKVIGWRDRPNGDASVNELHVLMGRLRKTLREFVPDHNLVQNVAGIGYKLVLPPELKGEQPVL